MAELLKEYNEAENYFISRSISISTITINCKLNAMLDFEKFSKYFLLIPEFIVPSMENIRNTLTIDNIDEKIQFKKSKRFDNTNMITKSKKNTSNETTNSKPPMSFYNQVSFQMKMPNNKLVNIKIFCNSSIHITGCTSMIGIFLTLMNFINILHKGLVDKNGNKIEFVLSEIPLDVDSMMYKERLIFDNSIEFMRNNQYENRKFDILIYDFKIRLIKVDTVLPFEIHKDTFTKIIIMNHTNLMKSDDKIEIEPTIPSVKERIGTDKIECDYKSGNGHPCVNIKLKIPGKAKYPSMFIFQTKNAIITGATCMQEIIEFDKIALELMYGYEKQIRIVNYDIADIRRLMYVEIRRLQNVEIDNEEMEEYVNSYRRINKIRYNSYNRPNRIRKKRTKEEMERIKKQKEENKQRQLLMTNIILQKQQLLEYKKEVSKKLACLNSELKKIKCEKRKLDN